jgi:hypothetical protein
MEASSSMNEVLTSIFNKFDLILGGAVTLLGKWAWDKQTKGSKPLSIDGDSVDLTSPLTTRDTVMIWLTDRVHKAKNEMEVPILKIGALAEELKIKQAYLEKDHEAFKLESAARVARLHDHIDMRSDKIEKN